eukprot:scaffold4066_cov63-Cyclotella_meneghiniana.AAC.3
MSVGGCIGPVGEERVGSGCLESGWFFGIRSSRCIFYNIYGCCGGDRTGADGGAAGRRCFRRLAPWDPCYGWIGLFAAVVRWDDAGSCCQVFVIVIAHEKGLFRRMTPEKMLLQDALGTMKKFLEDKIRIWYCSMYQCCRATHTQQGCGNVIPIREIVGVTVGRCLPGKTPLAAATSRLGVGTDGTPVLDGIGTRRGMVYSNVDDEENHTQSGEAAGVVGLQKPPRHRTKGAAPQGNPDGQLCPPPWLLERWL